MTYALLVDSMPILPAVAIKLSKDANISTVSVRRKAIFTDTIHILLSYAQVFKADYGVRFVNVRVLDIVEAIKSSNLLSSNSRATYVHYLKDGKRIMKSKAVLPRLRKVGENAPAA